MPNPNRAGRPVDRSKDEAILNAVRALLFTQNPQPFSVDAVARKANVSKMTLYSRYPTREALIDASVQLQAKKLSSAISIGPSDSQDLQQALTQFGVDLLSFLLSDDHLGFIRALSSAPEITAESLSQIYQSGPLATLDTLTNWLKQADTNGLATFSQPSKNAEMLMGMLIGLDLIRAGYGEPCDNSKEKIEKHAHWVVSAFLQIYR
jgi:TetR/AcrR family transcriptional repressor of mexJK operon